MLFCDIAFFWGLITTNLLTTHQKQKNVQTDKETFGSIWIHVKATLSDSEFESSLVFKKF